jgi:hypothetical protein
LIDFGIMLPLVLFAVLLSEVEWAVIVMLTFPFLGRAWKGGVSMLLFFAFYGVNLWFLHTVLLRLGVVK